MVYIVNSVTVKQKQTPWIVQIKSCFNDIYILIYSSQYMYIHMLSISKKSICDEDQHTRRSRF